MNKVFISYSRKDIEFAKRLAGELKKNEMDLWVDWDDIPPTVDWWKQIEKGIEEADIFLFLISPDSAASKVCRQEIGCAVKNGKRLIPIVVRDIQSEDTPPNLGRINYIFFRESDNFDSAIKNLQTAIHTDYDWVQAHRRLQVKALEWERNQYNNGFLLRGKDLKDAEAQFVTNSSKEPYPTDLQRGLVLKSRQYAKRQRGWLTLLAVVTVVIFALAIYGFFQAQSAEIEATRANAITNQAIIAMHHAQAKEQGVAQVDDSPTAIPTADQSTTPIPACTNDQTQSCNVPTSKTLDEFCVDNNSYGVYNLPINTTFEVLTPGFTCLSEKINSLGEPRISCTGLTNEEFQVSFCNSTCSPSSKCEAGFGLNSALGCCAPLSATENGCKTETLTLLGCQ